MLNVIILPYQELLFRTEVFYQPQPIALDVSMRNAGDAIFRFHHLQRTLLVGLRVARRAIPGELDTKDSIVMFGRGRPLSPNL